MQEVTIKNERENPLFKRREITFQIEEAKTPSRLEVVNLASEKFSCPKESIKIKNIGGKFGSNVFDVDLYIYNSEEEKNLIEMKKKKDEAVKEALSKPAEEVKEEVPEAPEEKVETPVETTEEVKKETQVEEKLAKENKSKETKE
ncbi:MAG: hypothetical protein WDZ77_02925 [Candidatus Pacearchaeota archaeon]